MPLTPDDRVPSPNGDESITPVVIDPNGIPPASAAPTEPATPAAPEPEPPLRLSMNVTLDYPVLDDTKQTPGQFPIFSIRVTPTEFERNQESYPAVDPSVGADGKRWVQAWYNAMGLLPAGKMYEQTAQRPSAAWRQGVEFEGRMINAQRPGIDTSDTAQKISGTKAVALIQNRLGLGTTLYIPLWHSGIWLTLKAPADSALLNLEQQIADEKITLGRVTGGMVFSNASVYINNYLVSFILDHVLDCNIKDWSIDLLRDLILTTDIQPMAWGSACTIYPNGYTLHQPCTADITVCKHVSKGHVNLTKMSWIDNNALNKAQRIHMADRNVKHTAEAIRQYQRQGLTGEARAVQLTDTLSVALAVPSVNRYIASGYRWVDGIVTMVEEATSDRLSAAEKDDFIDRHASLTTLRQYAHFIKHIDELNAQIDDEETIEETLNILSADNGILERLLAAIGKYIEDVTVNLIAIPSYNCPVCKGPMMPAEIKHPFLIPMEANQLFFDLRDRKLFRVRKQESNS